MTDPNENAHLLQQHQELSRQIEVAEAAMKGAKSAEGGATQTLQNQLKTYQDELAKVDAQMKAAGMSTDEDEAMRERQVKQAQDQANITTVDVEENKRQEEAQKENTANRNKPAAETHHRSGRRE